MFTIEMLPAQRGDCLWLTYGEEGDLHHVLVDAGPRETSEALVPELVERIKAAGGKNSVELFVITHIDADHIQGVVRLLTAPGVLGAFKDVWFNAFRHLPVLGVFDGEQLTMQLKGSKRWNKAFGGEDAAVVMPEGTVAPKPVKLKGGLEITLLSPTLDKLARLAPKWKKYCDDAGIVPGTGVKPPKPVEVDGLLGTETVEDLVAKKFQKDPEPPNGSSIAFIASYKGVRVLLGADAHPDVLAASLLRLGPPPHEFAAVKVSHHGSRKNTSPALLDVVRSPRWLFSSNGAQFQHPNDECVARVVVSQAAHRPTLAFNYDTEFNSRWKDDRAKSAYKYKTVYPKAGKAGLVVKLA